MRTIKLIYPFLDQKQVGNKIAIIDTEQVKHLYVLKANPSDAKRGRQKYEFIASDGGNFEARVELKQLTKEGAQFQITEFLDIWKPTISGKILLPVIKPDLLEQAVEQATQLNIYDSIVIYFSDHTRLTEKKFSDNKLVRLDKKAQSSFSQSKATILPKVSMGGTLAEAIAMAAETPTLFLVPDSDKDTKNVDYAKLKSYINGSKEIMQLCLIIGAEGGFSDRERKFMTEVKAPHVVYRFKFGESILKTETASTVISGLIKACML